MADDLTAQVSAADSLLASSLSSDAAPLFRRPFSNASATITYPGGTGSPMRSISPRDPAFPPIDFSFPLTFFKSKIYISVTQYPVYIIINIFSKLIVIFQIDAAYFLYFLVAEHGKLVKA